MFTEGSNNSAQILNGQNEHCLKICHIHEEPPINEIQDNAIINDGRTIIGYDGPEGLLCRYRALWVNLPGLTALLTVCGLCGLVVFSRYKDCDPLRWPVDKPYVSKRDQVRPDRELIFSENARIDKSKTWSWYLCFVFQCNPNRIKPTYNSQMCVLCMSKFNVILINSYMFNFSVWLRCI